MANKQTKYLSFVWRWEWYTVGSVVVGKYTQTRQRWLRARIVKSDHGRHYKEALAVYRKIHNNNSKHCGVEDLKTRK